MTGHGDTVRVKLPTLDDLAPLLLSVLDEDEAMSAFQVLMEGGYRIVSSDALAALEREIDEAVTQRKAAEEWARVMEHERDFEQQVVVVDLRSRLEDAERENDTLRAALEEIESFPISGYHAGAAQRMAREALASVRDEQAEGEAGSSAAASAVGERQGRQPASPSVEQAGSAPATAEARRAILAEVDSERNRQDAKWGGIPGTERRDDHTYAAVLGEEFGECCKAWLERDIAALRSELVQTAAVAVAWAEELDNGGAQPRPYAPSGGGGE